MSPLFEPLLIQLLCSPDLPSQNLPPSEQEELDKQVKDCRKQFHDKQDVYDTEHSKQVEQLKEEIRSECEAREKLRTPSRTSVGSSITIFPPEARSQEGSETSSASPDMTGSKVVKETKSANDNEEETQAVVDNEEETQAVVDNEEETQAVVDNEEETQAVVDNEEEMQETQAVVDNEEETQAVVVEASETVVNEA